MSKKHASNKIEIKEGYGVCYLSNGKSFLFDECDEQVVSNHYWFENDDGFGHSRIRTKLENGKMMELTVALGYPRGFAVPNTTDFRRGSVKTYATSTEKAYCRKLSKNNTTGVKGVSKQGKKYIAGICYRGTHFDLGRYATLSEAKRAREIGELPFRNN